MSRHDRPNYEDVRWDYGAAGAAIAALRRAADEVERGAADTARSSWELVDLWRGQHRATYDLRRRALEVEAQVLAADCRAAAGAIAAADQRARAEQARREREREEWEREEREREEREERERERRRHGQPEV